MRAIAGGGRYDNLVKLISGGKVDLPALGFGMGDVVLADLLKEKNLLPSLLTAIDVFLLIEDESVRPQSLAMVQQIRDLGLISEYSLTPAKGDKQFKRALELQARFTVRLESREGRICALVKDLKVQQQFESEPETTATLIFEKLKQ